ncbi:efflux RND transporter periplasmic adaptor subunit [Marinimicrobium sp. ARAG 43.8]|uniref:efflux RND transporter periplasmic adaptor subunit n=1 Tax=Marinimicrobium sp. ARAG 43.8 TaxID=3418719 RepID=UPI003CFB36D3
MRRITPFLLLSFAAAAMLSACGQKGQEAAGGQMPAPQAGFIEIEPQSFTLVNELPGRTSPYQVAEVRPQVTGLIKERLFEEGEMVEAGEPLYQIDDNLYRASLANARGELATARANLESAQITADRYERLIEDRAVSQQELDQARATLGAGKAQVQSAEAAVQTARINLNYTTITAPITGRIGRSVVTAGALVTANQSQALATIRQLDPIYVDLTQSYTELRYLREALARGELQTVGEDEAAVTLQAEGGSSYGHTGKLQFSEYAVDENTGSVTLRALFPNPDGELLPGMFVRASLPQASRASAILVPQKAVAREPTGGTSALVIGENNIVEKRQVVTERTVGNQWLVTEGLDVGDRLIVDGLQKIRPGSPVTPVSVVEEQNRASSNAEEITQD